MATIFDIAGREWQDPPHCRVHGLSSSSPISLCVVQVFRTPLTLPFELFPKWYAAFDRFVELIHSDEFEKKVRLVD